MNLKIVYMGTPDFSVKPLDELNKKYDVIAVVTQPDKKIGRKQEVRYSKVKEYLSNDEFKLYSLIYKRTLASLMADALTDQTTVIFDNNNFFWFIIIFSTNICIK